jgi:hypothetical protein
LLLSDHSVLSLHDLHLNRIQEVFEELSYYPHSCIYLNRFLELSDCPLIST